MMIRFDPPLRADEKALIASLAAFALIAGYVVGKLWVFP
jgi:hypothetical protein